MQDKALKLLEQIITRTHPEQQRPGKEDVRPTELLRPHAGHTDTVWAMHVPECFNEALDICQTTRAVNKVQHLEWTQGSSFYFKPGDVIYDRDTQKGEWETALGKITKCIQINAATAARPQEKETPRFPGSVEFTIFTPDKAKKKLEPLKSNSMTQDQFVALLIAGHQHLR